MRLAMFGDVVGRSGRRGLSAHLPALRDRLGLDFVIVNAENAAGGYGITEAVAEEIFEAGADALTLGNHDFDQPASLPYIDREPRVLRPANYPATADAPGRGAHLYDAPGGRRVLVINVLGRLFMDALDDPVAATALALEPARLGEVADAVVIDFHAEATSEKQSMAYYCDGRVSAVVGTHTHVPTADARILAGGTAFISDLGMCGDYESVLGMQIDEPLRRFTTRMRGGRLTPSEGTGSVCGLFVETDDATGLAVRCAPIRIGGALEPTEPTVAVAAE